MSNKKLVEDVDWVWSEFPSYLKDEVYIYMVRQGLKQEQFTPQHLFDFLQIYSKLN